MNRQEDGVFDVAQTQPVEHVRRTGRIVATVMIAAMSLSACARRGEVDVDQSSSVPATMSTSATPKQSTDQPSVSTSPSPSSTETSSGDTTITYPCENDWTGKSDAAQQLTKQVQSLAAKYIVYPKGTADTAAAHKADTNHYAPGAAIIVGCGNAVLSSLGIGQTGPGMDDKGKVVPSEAVTTDKTEYDLASITKTFTSAGIFMLEQEGKLSLDDTVIKYFPDFDAKNPTWKDKATIQLLLQMRAGIAPPLDNYDKHFNPNDTPATAQQKILQTVLEYEPGKGYDYSNFGYDILYFIANQVTQKAYGQTMEQYLTERLFKPLGMNHTGYTVDLDCAPTSPDDDQSKVEAQCSPQDAAVKVLGGSAGHAGAFSTADDMSKFMRLWLGGGSEDGKEFFSADDAIAAATALPDKQQYNTGAMSNNNQFFSTLMASSDTYTGQNCDPNATNGMNCLVAFGHNGWNGTEWVVDPASGLWSIILTNGTYHAESPENKSRISYVAINDALVTATKNLTVIPSTPMETQDPQPLPASPSNSAAKVPKPKLPNSTDSPATAQPAVALP